MKFLRGLLLLVSVIAFALSATVFVVSYSVISSASPSLVMDVLDTAGGVEEVVAEVLESQIPNMPISKEDQRAIMAAAKAALTPEMVRDLTGQVISGFKKYLGSAGTDSSVTLNLRELKTAFFNELKKVYPNALDKIEEVMEEVPDTANIAGFLPVEAVKEIARPYKIATNIPLIAITVAVASGLLICLASGFLPGLRTTGWTLVIVAAAVLVATFVGSGYVEKQLPRLIGDFDMSDSPVKFDLAAVANGLTGFVLSRVRLVSGVCGAAGGVLAFLPVIAKRRAAPEQPSV